MVKNGAIWKFSLAFVLGVLVGYKIIPPGLVGAAFVVVLIACLIYAAQNNIYKFFTYVPYVIYTEVFIRASVRSVPYLSMEYLFVASFSILIINYTKNKVAHTKAYYFLIGFALLEVLNGFFPSRPVLLRAIFFNSFTSILAVIWASYNVLSPTIINKLLANIKVASLFLAGIIVVAHIKGNISYGTFSSSEASNGLAPVQISGYLGVASSILFMGLMNPLEKNSRILNFILFVTVTVIMVLTFSRGGLYFIAIVITLYMIFNRKSLGNYFKYLMLVPVAIVAYNFIVTETGGAILRRYGEKGSSNRDVLVLAGFSLFLEHPVTGVGTSNFGTAIVDSKLFSQESTAHNEFVRAMAEHGVLGIITYWGFFAITFLTIFRRKEPNRQYSIYFLVLFCLIVVHNGLKISVQPILLILAIANPSITRIARKKISHAIRQPQALQQSA